MLYLLQQVFEAPLYLSSTLLKHIYCSGFIYRRYSTPQKTRTTVMGQWNAAIELMYSGGSKKRRNMRHVAAVFHTHHKKPATIAHFNFLIRSMGAHMNYFNLLRV